MNLRDAAGIRAQSRQIGRHLSKYRILELVGQGQFGKVFCATDRKTGQLVALKEFSQRSLPTSQFLREVRVLLTLQHPNIVTCRALEHTLSARYLVMDYCEGGTLRNLLTQEHSLSLSEGLQLMRGILEGLAQAHQQGIIHCDIKPENILLALGAGVWLPRLSDFGIARGLSERQSSRVLLEAADGSIETIGPPGYTAPEAFYGLYSQASDIYSVGILLFELLMGYRPFTGVPAKLMWAHLNQPLELPPALPQVLKHLLQKALAKLPARRFAGAGEMEQAIEQAMDDPEVKELGDRTLPWQSHSAVALSLPKATYREHLPAPITSLVAGQGYFYGALGTQVKIWLESNKTSISVDFPASLTGLLVVEGGCLVTAQRQIYWLPTDSWQPQHLLKFERDFSAAADLTGQRLAVAIAGQLQFYSLRNRRLTKTIQSAANQPTMAPLRNPSLAVPTLPQLMFLDRRHLLAVWPQPEHKKPQTLMKVYTRRGTVVGVIRLPLLFEQLVVGSEPYTLWGISRQPNAAIWQIHLKTVQVRRMNGSSQPVYLSPVPGGVIEAAANGQILWLSDKGQRLGNFQGPTVPTTSATGSSVRRLASWGNTSLAIATNASAGSWLYFLEVEVKGAQ